jgi:nitrate/TMAO reductase-like tetraheme cytochrome c subunit
MMICPSKLKMTGTKIHADLIIAAKLALVMVVLAVTSLNARAAGSALSKADQQCLGCHSAKGLEKKLANGETLSLHVQGPAFAESVHKMLGCAVCHADTTLENHPPLKTKIASIRENSLELTKVCRSCHADIFKLYEGSIHAALLRDGNPIAPICTDCHNPHAVRPKAAREPITDVACGKCHGSIFDAYVESVHGKARSAGNAGAPICYDCHRAHDVSAATTGDQLKNACLGCHQGALDTHQTWLPNAGLHFDAVSCPACHSPAAKRKVDLRLYDNVAQTRIAERAGVPQFESRARSADAKGVGLDAMALQSLLREFNREGMDNKTTLRGRLEVSTGVEAHQLAAKTKAIQDCARCHRQGSDPFQSVTVSIVGPDGRPVRYGAQHEVLNSMISVDSVGGFYAIGGTRIKVLDMLLGLALLLGVGVPVGHLTLTWLFRRYAKKIGGREDS